MLAAHSIDTDIYYYTCMYIDVIVYFEPACCMYCDVSLHINAQRCIAMPSIVVDVQIGTICTIAEC